MESKVEEVQNVIEHLVHPREKKTSNIQDLNQFQEIANVKRKEKKLKKLKPQKKKLSRNEMKNIGLYSLPRKTMKYDDYRELNELWNSYMEQILGSDMENLKKKFDTTSNHYDSVSATIHKSDFHGAKLKIVQSKCVSLTGQKGIVVLDTKGTFNIICKDNVLRIVPKNASIFELKWRKARFTVYGKNLAIRTAERSVKKIKTVRLIEI
ncbi:hypothetical protein PVAND_007292 [Polypedilum vanderplanki]|uniref:Ribonuclease P protein subunit p29 n=1 Tax=Polypedilum vanderplanki TaxID=319348 RepID=A0A9J6C5T5_POLVA|nr:hypothetical protein PVAND_007292 [Polypedilum vanderplanki]